MDPLVRAAAATISRGSKSFALAARLFEPEVRARALLLYAWCRHCDDVTDEQALGQGYAAQAGTAEARVDRLREETLRALLGRPSDAVPFRAIARFSAETGLPEQLPMAHLDGFLHDAAEGRCRSLDCTMLYCWQVAGVVGEMMALAMGVSAEDRDTLDRAADLGLAFQLANIARDVLEDDARGRCYLPESWLAEADIPPGEQARPEHRLALAGVVGRLLEIADAHEKSARIGALRLPFRSAWAVLSAAGIYGAIGRKVRAAGPRAWDRRQATSLTEKLALVARARIEARKPAPHPAPPRDGLWTMRSNGVHG